jgi:hypothetical protein
MNVGRPRNVKGVHMDSSRRRALVVLFVVGLLVVAATALILSNQSSATADNPPTAQEIVRGGVPVGSELADELGLTLMPGFDHECDFYQEVEESGAGYCLDGLGGRVDQYVIGLALRGVVPSDDQLATIEETIARNEPDSLGTAG